MTTPANPPAAWAAESGTSTNPPAGLQTPVRHAHVKLPYSVPFAMIRVRVRGGQSVGKWWRTGRGEPRGGWRSMRSERLSRIRRAYRARRR